MNNNLTVNMDNCNHRRYLPKLIAGGPEQLVVEDIEDPGPGEIRVRLRAASLNHIDIYLREGQIPAARPRLRRGRRGS